MSEKYAEALGEQSKKNVYDRTVEAVANMPALEKAGLLADVAGIVDPTPASDSVGMLISIAHGDKNGRWAGGNQPVDGNGVFVFDAPVQLPGKNGGTVTSIEFKNGAPDFDKYVVGKKHELWQVTGDATEDGKELMRMMRETDPQWKPPNKAEYVLHHFENGSVGYVPRVVHDKADGGVAHTGGNSMLNNDLF
jgi:hypothetical protein